MRRLDCNCFTGGWPFYKVRHPSFEALCELHQKNRINGGFVSATESIFYNDPYEAELALSEKLVRTPEYRQVMTVNPLLPGTEEIIHRAVRELRISGIRIVPGMHGYKLDSPELSELCDLMRVLGLPLFLTLRMEDERVTYLLHPKSIPLNEVCEFLEKQTRLPTLLCNIRLHELLRLRECLFSRQDVYADCCGLKDTSYALETLEENHLTSRLVYGSLTPIYCLESSLSVVELSGITQKTKEIVLSCAGFCAALQAL